MSTMGKNMLKFCIDSMIKIMQMIDNDGNNNYGSIIQSTLIKTTMSYWKTGMCLYAEEKLTETEDIEKQCGIFTGDSHNHYFPLAYAPHGKNTQKKTYLLLHG
jgi:hypothetical protein